MTPDEERELRDRIATEIEAAEYDGPDALPVWRDGINAAAALVRGAPDTTRDGECVPCGAVSDWPELPTTRGSET